MNDCVGKETGIFDTKFQYTHANFWASQDKGTATLFFSEFSNDEHSNYEPICYPVSGLSTQGIIFISTFHAFTKNLMFMSSHAVFFFLQKSAAVTVSIKESGLYIQSRSVGRGQVASRELHVENTILQTQILLVVRS